MAFEKLAVAILSISVFIYATREMLASPAPRRRLRSVVADPKTVTFKDLSVNGVAEQAAMYNDEHHNNNGPRTRDGIMTDNGGGIGGGETMMMKSGGGMSSSSSSSSSRSGGSKPFSGSRTSNSNSKGKYKKTTTMTDDGRMGESDDEEEVEENPQVEMMNAMEDREGGTGMFRDEGNVMLVENEEQDGTGYGSQEEEEEEEEQQQQQDGYESEEPQEYQGQIMKHQQTRGSMAGEPGEEEEEGEQNGMLVHGHTKMSPLQHLGGERGEIYANDQGGGGGGEEEVFVQQQDYQSMGGYNNNNAVYNIGAQGEEGSNEGSVTMMKGNFNGMPDQRYGGGGGGGNGGEEIILTDNNNSNNNIMAQSEEEGQFHTTGGGQMMIMDDNSDGSVASSLSSRRLEFIHVTKSGGSAIETAAASQAGISWGACHYRSIKYQQCDNPDWADVKRTMIPERMPRGYRYMGEPWHCPPQWADPNPMDDDNIDTFLVVRNPYDRIVSEFYCSSFGYKGSKVEDVDVFNEWLAGNLTELTQVFHGHMLPQHYYVYDSITGDRIVRHILRYENLQEEFDALMEAYGLPIHLPPKSDKSTFHTKESKSARKVMTPMDISPENLQMINQLYQRDFEFFGYEMMMPQFQQEQQRQQPVVIMEDGGTTDEDGAAQYVEGEYGRDADGEQQDYGENSDYQEEQEEENEDGAAGSEYDDGDDNNMSQEQEEEEEEDNEEEEEEEEGEESEEMVDGDMEDEQQQSGSHATTTSYSSHSKLTGKTTKGTTTTKSLSAPKKRTSSTLSKSTTTPRKSKTISSKHYGN